MLAAFPRWMAREILSKRNFLDFESADSAISRSEEKHFSGILTIDNTVWNVILIITAETKYFPGFPKYYDLIANKNKRN
jgi:hypothetical protein